AASGVLEVFRRGLVPLRVALFLVGQLLTFGQARHARPLDSRDVDEHVRPAAVGLNEAETLGRVEPFHCASWHRSNSVKNRQVARGTMSVARQNNPGVSAIKRPKPQQAGRSELE